MIDVDLINWSFPSGMITALGVWGAFFLRPLLLVGMAAVVLPWAWRKLTGSGD